MIVPLYVVKGRAKDRIGTVLFARARKFVCAVVEPRRSDLIKEKYREPEAGDSPRSLTSMIAVKGFSVHRSIPFVSLSEVWPSAGLSPLQTCN